MKPCQQWRELARDVAGFCAFLLVALTAGVVINQARDHPVPLVYRSRPARLDQAVQSITKSSIAETPVTTNPGLNSAVPIVAIDEFKRLVDGRQGIILDARPEVIHRLGHVPGALSLPRNDFEAAYARLKSQLEGDREQPLLVYCSDADCEDSELVANALLKLGYRQVRRFKGGWADWTNARLPEEKNP